MAKKKQQEALVPVDEATLAREGNEAREVLELVKAQVIATQDDMDFANGCLKEVKAKRKDLKALRETATKPMLEALETVRSWFRPAEGFYEAAEGIWKDKIKAFLQVQAAAQQKALEAVAQAHAQADTALVAQTMAAAVQATVELPKNISVTERWMFRVVDPTQVPACYLSPDPAKIQAAVAQGAREIPGVEIYRDDIVTQRRS